jgi:hypothetical protein
MLYIIRHQVQDVVAFAGTKSVRTEMRCFLGDTGVVAMLEAEFPDNGHRAIPLFALPDTAQARPPGQRGQAASGMQLTGSDEMAG